MKTFALPNPASVSRSGQRVVLFWLISFIPALAALLHLTLWGRVSYAANVPLYLCVDAACSAISAAWLASRFGGTRVALGLVTLLLSIFIFVINWTIFAGGCCQTIGT